MALVPVEPEELARIERFVAAYNALDEFFQRQIGEPQTFRSAVDWFARRNPWWRDQETLRVFAQLRNFLVHEKTRPFDYPAVPSEASTREIESIRDRLLRPSTVGEDFSGEVHTLQSLEPVLHALQHMEHQGHNRFPVYDGHNFLGLLTEKGIARAVARALAAGESFDPETPVRTILPRESKRKTYRFTSLRTPVSQAAFWFHDNTFLEAVLITENGDANEKLHGIITRGDVAGRVE